MTDDPINHPAHYTSHPSGVECRTIARHMTYNLGSAFKYIWRAGLKGDVVEDLRKAVNALNDEIARIETDRAEMRAELVRDVEAKYAAPQPAVTFTDTPLGPPGPPTNVIQFPPPGERWHE